MSIPVKDLYSKQKTANFLNAQFGGFLNEYFDDPEKMSIYLNEKGISINKKDSSDKNRLANAINRRL